MGHLISWGQALGLARASPTPWLTALLPGRSWECPANPFPRHLTPRISEVGRLRPGYTAAPRSLGFSVNLSSTRPLPTHLWGTHAGPKPLDLIRTAIGCGGMGVAEWSLSVAGAWVSRRIQDSLTAPKPWSFFHLATYWRYLGSTEPTYLHACEKKQVDSDHWKESATPTHSCQIIPTVPSVWGGLFFF